MPRCLMAKKWKAYPWPDRAEDELPPEQPDPPAQLDVFAEVKRARAELLQQQQQQQPVAAPQTDDEEIDVVGDADTARAGQPGGQHQTCWGPHSPTAGATAPSPPPLNASGALYYHGESLSLAREQRIRESIRARARQGPM